MEHSGLALPVSGTHIQLLDFLLMIALTLVLVFMTYLAGSLMISVSKKSKFNKTGDSKFFKLASDYAAHVTDYPIIWFACGIVPYLAAILAYVQLMSGAPENQVVFLFSIGFFAYAAALAMAWVYKENMKTAWTQLSLQPETYHAEKSKTEHHDQTLLSGNYGGWAVFFVLVAMWFTVSAIVLAYNPQWWSESIAYPLFSWGTQFKFSMLAFGGTALASLGFTYLKFSANDPDEMGSKFYQSFAKFESGKLAVRFTILTPVFIGLSVASLPPEAASSWYYLLCAVAFVLLAICAHYNYALLKSGKSSYAIGGYWTLLLVFVFISASEHRAFSEVNEMNMTLIGHNYDVMEAELIAERSDVPVIEVDGEQVFKQKCASCHRMDQKLVGPAYIDVVPKYYEDQTALVKFILNPYPVNPSEFPGGMANPGLNPDEANAVANYLTTAVKESLGDGSDASAEGTPTEGDEVVSEEQQETEDLQDQ